ncbi:hypothetical protein O3M35_013132 [Rhynocoris fuscipes]|uniref:SUN domain-containing protein n=1 Tax=Rhynocoris fuscipes TaxID=488301 RepID=A0AAW1CJH9_9HEMI
MTQYKGRHLPGYKHIRQIKTDIATLVSTFSKPFLWTYRAILHLFTTCLFMIPTILSQVFQLLTNCFLIFIQKLSGLPTGSISEFSKTTEKSSILDSSEIRKIVLDILTEKEKEEANNLNQMKTAVNDQVNFLNDLVVKVNQKLASLENLSESSSTLTRFADIQEYVGHVVKGMLKQYHADRTGRPDFALMSYGGTIISIRCTQTYTKDSGNIYLFGFPLWNVHNKPEVIIKPGIMPGECWAFEGSQGYAVIKLAMPIYVTGFTLEHTPKELTAHGHIKSAPQHFSVWALTELMDKNPLLLGRFRYLDNGESLQYFDSEKLDIPVQMVELRIESNHGSIDYTCIYRFRVHGIPA